MTQSDKAEAEWLYPMPLAADIRLTTLAGMVKAARAAFEAGAKFGREDERSAREQQHAICPECLGERRIKGALCPRCHGSAQIHRSKLRDVEVAPFERAALTASRPAAGVEEMEARKEDAAYEERNKIVAALARIFPSWHFHDSQAYLFVDLPPYAKSWDGHDTDEKYRRLAALASSPPPAPAGERERVIEDGLGERLRWYLTILRGMGGRSDASDDGPSWLDTFCDDRGEKTDTYNMAEKRGFTKTMRDDRFDTATVILTDVGLRALASEAGPAEGER